MTTVPADVAWLAASEQAQARDHVRGMRLVGLCMRLVVAGLAGVTLAVGGGGCASSSTPSSGSRAPTAGTEAAQLYETDQQFSKMARVLGVAEAFRQFVAERAILLPNGELPVEGRQAIYEHHRQVGDAQLIWEPVAAEVARSGELGYTWGFYEVRVHDPTDGWVMGHGKYTTIWQKQPDGGWKVILDIGNTGPPPPPR